MRFGSSSLLRGCLLLIVGVTTSCAERHSALSPAGPQAEAIELLSWQLIAVCAAVWLIVNIFFFVAMFRRSADDDSSFDRKRTIAVGAGAGVTVVILFVLLILSASTGNRLDRIVDEDAMVIDVIGKRWWWEVVYHHPEHGRIVSANEIHIPTGRSVYFRFTSADVIHSFWVPRLHGKMDLIPGHTTGIWIQADEPGVYRGQCAEFCGIQHTLMAKYVIASPPDEFERRMARAAEASVIPGTDEQRRGQEVFFTSGCPSCHVVRGTERASGGSLPVTDAVTQAELGPDLTHFASRLSIGAGTLPNRRGHLAGWIVDSQSSKPGNLMPRFRIPAADLEALLDYMESLE